MSDQDNTVVLGSGYGASTNYSISGAGIDTITLDPSSWSTSSITIPNGGYTLASGTSTTTSWSSGQYNYSPTSVHINADGLIMKEGSDIKIGSKSLTEAIEKIEERLGILKPNPELEERWGKLKELRKQYMELEKDLLEKEKIMKILKET